MAEGIEVRRRKDGTKSYRAIVWDPVRAVQVKETFASMAAARAWRHDTSRALRDGKYRRNAAPTLADAVEAWIAGAKAGTIRTRGRKVFKPSTIRAVEQNYRLRLADEFGHRRLNTISTGELQDHIEQLAADGIGASTIESTILPLRLVYRRAKQRDIVDNDPTETLELPEKTSRGNRKPPAPKDAARLLNAAPEPDRAIWATAMLAGLRRGELMALKVSDLDLKAGVVNVRESYDPGAQEYGPPKSRYGVRKVPITATLGAELRAHMLRTGRRDGLLFGGGAKPFSPSALQKRADTAWKTAKLDRATLHECRHLYASMSIAAGINAHALCKAMGHSSIKVTYDEYGHLFPGNEAEAATLLDTYVTAAFAASS